MMKDKGRLMKYSTFLNSAILELFMFSFSGNGLIDEVILKIIVAFMKEAVWKILLKIQKNFENLNYKVVLKWSLINDNIERSSGWLRVWQWMDRQQIQPESSDHDDAREDSQQNHRGKVLCHVLGELLSGE